MKRIMYPPPPKKKKKTLTNKFAWVKYQNMIDSCSHWFAIIEFII